MQSCAPGAMAAVQRGGRMGSQAGIWQAAVVTAVALAHAAGLWGLLGGASRPATSAAAPQIAMVMVLSETAARAVPQLQPLLPPPAPVRAAPQSAPKPQAGPAPRKPAAPAAPAAAAAAAVVAADEPLPGALPEPHSVPASAAGGTAVSPAAEGAAEDAAAVPAAKVVAASAQPRQVESVDYLRAPVLEYPSASRRFGEHGRVVLRVLVGRDGQAEQIELVEATAFRRLNDAAIEAARRALYKPHTENGVPQPAWALVALSFQLRR